MAITITATAGSASANSFVTEAEVIAYMAARLNASTWDTVTGVDCTETEKAALVEATRELSNRNWKGLRVDDTQALSFPRQYCPNPDSSIGDWYATTVIPQRIKDACCELAFQFVKAGTTDVAAEDSKWGVSSQTVDVIGTSYEAHMRSRGLARYPRIMALISPLLEGVGLTARVVRG